MAAHEDDQMSDDSGDDLDRSGVQDGNKSTGGGREGWEKKERIRFSKFTLVLIMARIKQLIEWRDPETKMQLWDPSCFSNPVIRAKVILKAYSEYNKKIDMDKCMRQFKFVMDAHPKMMKAWEMVQHDTRDLKALPKQEMTTRKRATWHATHAALLGALHEMQKRPSNITDEDVPAILTAMERVFNSAEAAPMPDPSMVVRNDRAVPSPMPMGNRGTLGLDGSFVAQMDPHRGYIGASPMAKTGEMLPPALLEWQARQAHAMETVMSQAAATRELLSQHRAQTWLREWIDLGTLKINALEKGDAILANQIQEELDTLRSRHRSERLDQDTDERVRNALSHSPAKKSSVGAPRSRPAGNSIPVVTPTISPSVSTPAGKTAPRFPQVPGSPIQGTLGTPVDARGQKRSAEDDLDDPDAPKRSNREGKKRRLE